MVPRRWRLRYLVVSWIAYWAVLFLITFWKPLVTCWRVTRDPRAQGSASFELSGNPYAIALWLLGPPVLLTILWLSARRRFESLPPAGSRR